VGVQVQGHELPYLCQRLGCVGGGVDGNAQGQAVVGFKARLAEVPASNTCQVSRESVAWMDGAGGADVAMGR